jgi:sugar O-acyltransferase (sialic acid O-acetyltransferase NeuD family)
MQKVLIFPCNGNGIEALCCIPPDMQVIGFVDDTLEKQGTSVFGVKVYSRDAFKLFPDAQVLAVPGSPTSFMRRAEIIDGLHIAPERFARVIHRNATISPFASIGKNVLIMAGVVLTANCTLGNHVCVLPNSVIHHDSVVGDYTLVGSNVTIAGYVRVGENCYIGSGTSIINGIEIGKRVLVGMGSNVIRSIESDKKMVGNPARSL